jgi:capsular polysaccharide transport system permease protein
MDLQDKPPIAGRGTLSALDRAKILSQALSDAARRTRLSTRSRRSFSAGGFAARRGARFMRWAGIGSFVLMVAIPTIAAMVYYAFIASDQYVAEARFTVSGGAPPIIDGIGALTGIPAVAVIQDTQIVTNYVESRAALEKLEKLIDIRSLYSTDEADFLARFKADRPIEKFLKYWQSMCSVSIQMPSGVVVLKVRAFTPEDAARIAGAVINISEELINDLNIRMNNDAVAGAQEELERTSQRLTAAQVALEKARNQEGILDAAKTGEALNGLITEARSDLLKLQEQYTSQARFVSTSAPQMTDLKARIDATASQIKELESKLTNAAPGNLSEAPLSASMTKFAELDLERQTAERLYAGSVAALELARITAERRLMYLNTFVMPVAPQEAQYPKRVLYSLLVAGGSLALWGLCGGLVVLIRNNMA